MTNGKDPTAYNIKIENTGAAQDTILVTSKIINVTGGPEPDVREWFAWLSRDQVTLNPGESAVVVLTVSTSCNCQEGSVATVRVSGESGNDPGISAHVDTYTTRGIKEGDILVELDIEDVSVFFELTAGQHIAFSLEVYNYQSIPQTYTLTNTDGPDGWVLKFAQESFEVSAKSKYVVLVQTTIPLRNEPGEYIFSFNVQSDNDPNIIAFTDVPIILLPELTVEEIKSIPLTPKPGEYIDLQVIIRNQGQAVARSIVLNLYNGTEHSEEYMINTTVIPELYGSKEVTYNFTWLLKADGTFNFTAYVNPDFPIEEVANRFANNIKTSEITVKNLEPTKPPSNENGSGSDSTFELLSWVIQISIVILFISILIYFIFYRFRKSNDGEKTAKKIPLSRSFRGRVGYDSRSRRSRRANKQGRKKAHKEKLTARERARLKAQTMKGRSRKNR